MELTERLEWFMKMLRCKYPVDWQEYDSSLTPHGDLSDDRTRMLHKLLAGGGGLEQMRTMMEEPGVEMVQIGGNVGLLWGAPCFCFIVVGCTSNRIYQSFFSLAASWLVLRCSTIWANHSTIAGSS